MLFEKVNIYDEIPGIPSCHCSSLIRLPNNQLHCAFFAGQYEKSPDVGIWGAQLSLNSEKITWTKPKIIIKIPDHSMGSPVWYLTPQNRLFLFFHEMYHGKIIKGGWSTVNIQFISSDDFGVTWSKPQFLRRLWFWVLRTQPIITNNDTVVLPVHREAGQYQSMFYINEKLDLSGKWKRYGRLKTPKGCLEPAIAKDIHGNLLCSLRTKDGRIYFSRSMNHGTHWTKPEPSNMPNPNAQTCLLSLQSGKILLIYNHASKGRSPLTVRTTSDLGLSWSKPKNIESEPNQEFSYPAAIQTEDGRIHISYTYKRKKIAYCRLDEDWLSA